MTLYKINPGMSDRAKEIAQMLNEGKTIPEMSGELGVSVRAISRVMKAYGFRSVRTQ